MSDCKLSENSFIQIKPFMVINLGLSGNSLLIYAAIYGLTVNKGVFTGSFDYLAKWCNSSKRSVIQCIQKLEAQKLIEKKRTSKGCILVTTPVDTTLPKMEEETEEFHEEQSEEFEDEKSSSEGEKSSPNEVKKVHQCGEKSSPNNIVNSLGDNLDTNSKSHSRKSEEDAPKKSSQKHSYPKEYYTQIYDAYFANCKTLFSQGKFPCEKPVMNYKSAGSVVKRAIESYGFENVLNAVKNSVNHNWLLSDAKYSFSAIFTDKTITDLINQTYLTVEQANQKKPYSNYQNKSNQFHKPAPKRVDNMIDSSLIFRDGEPSKYNDDDYTIPSDMIFRDSTPISQNEEDSMTPIDLINQASHEEKYYPF